MLRSHGGESESDTESGEGYNVRWIEEMYVGSICVVEEESGVSLCMVE